MQVVRFILKNLDQYRAKFWLSLLAGLIESFASVAVPLLLATFTTSGLSQGQFIQLIIWLVVAVIISLATSWYIRRYGESVAFSFPNHLKLKYFAQLEQLPLSQLSKHHSGYILSMINQIGARISEILMDTFWTFTGIVANISLLIYFTATKSLGLTFLNLILFMIFVLISTVLARKMTRLANDQNRQSAVFSQYFVDFMANLTTIKRLGIKNFAQGQLNTTGNASNDTIQTFQNAHSNRWLLLHSIYFAANFITIGYLLYGVSKGTIPVSLLILFVSFYGNIRYIIERLAENIITFAETRVYINNLNEIIYGYSAQANGTATPKDWRLLSLKNISYQHADNAVVVKAPKLNINRGDSVCIYGTSGQGKSTVLNLIANYLEPGAGQITVDNVDYNRLDREWFACQLAFISQETELFNISLKDNLALGQKVTKTDLWQLLEDLELAGWARGLENGLDTIVGEKGLKLSAGQKQRINLARGILLNRELYLLDEPTSHLDESTEKVVVKAIQKYLKGKTIVAVTHRPEIKKICNKFYKMSHHTVVA